MIKAIKKTASVVVLLAATAIPISNASAGGFFGDIINLVVPGAGTVLDEWHREFKNKNPKHKAREEKFTNKVRQSIGLRQHELSVYPGAGRNRYTHVP